MWTALEGVMVGSRYELQSHLATGGMAAVFRAWDHRLHRPVAIKLLRQLADAEDRAIERFRREARAAAALRSPNIVEVHDFFEEDGCHYLVMELVEGVNLKEYLAANAPLDPEAAFSIAAQVCDALAVAHDAGYVHRDIKPQNILLGTDGSVKLTDFGIVHIPCAQTFTTEGMVLGTADYISPEQAQGLELGPTSDIYSLGVVLYEMLTGVLPFSGTTAVAVAMRHATAPVPPMRLVNPAIPRSVERLVLRALRKEPARRFPSAQAMAAVLRATQTDLVSLTRTDASGTALLTAASTSAGGSSGWRAQAARLSQLMPAGFEDGAGSGPDRSGTSSDAGWLDDDGDDYNDFAEHYAPAGLAAALRVDAASRLLAVLSVVALLLVGIVVLHLLR